MKVAYAADDEPKKVAGISLITQKVNKTIL